MRPDPVNTLLLNLNAFSKTGGIEKVSRILAKACYELAVEDQKTFCNLSLYDGETDELYCPKSHYKGFSGHKGKFILAAVLAGKKADKLILTHINLALVALLIKILNPRIKIYLFAHGIEIWRPLRPWKQRLLKSSYRILAVSSYTKGRLMNLHAETKEKVSILNNCLDPYFVIPNDFKKPQQLLERYKIHPEEKVVLTLCRLSSSEMYKGYDTVIKSLKNIDAPEWKYLLMGKYDQAELDRVSKLIEEFNLQDRIVLTGFIPDEELTDHLLLGDVFVMPSTEEGFGIVFIEAASCGLPLISGDADGSVDALLNGRLGQMVNTSDLDELTNSLLAELKLPTSKTLVQEECIKAFGYQNYKSKLRQLIIE